MDISGIRRRCKERGITLAELERHAGIGNGIIGKWGKSNNGPSAANLKKVADYFGCTMDELMKEDEGND